MDLGIGLKRQAYRHEAGWGKAGMIYSSKGRKHRAEPVHGGKAESAGFTHGVQQQEQQSNSA
jgi:hypothetical protein